MTKEINRFIGATLKVAMLLLAAGTSSAMAVPAPQSAGASGPYEASTESLRKHRVPRWYEDAKFGIFIHWGVFAVPAYHEWYVEFISPKANSGFMFGGPPYTATCGNLPEALCKAKVNEDAVRYHLAIGEPNFALRRFHSDVQGREIRPGGVGATLPGIRGALRGADRQARRRVRASGPPNSRTAMRWRRGPTGTWRATCSRPSGSPA